MSCNVIIIDDHPLFSRGLSQLIETQMDNTKPDLAIVDLNLGQEDGLELIKDIIVIHPQTKILVLSMHDERFYAERAIKAGAKGYIMKEEAESQVINAIKTVNNGEIYLSENEKARIKELSQGTNSDSGHFDSISTLSDRQLQIFTLVGKGLGTVEIAKKLNLSIKTIDTHKENIKAKLHCASSAELRQMAIEWTNKAV